MRMGNVSLPKVTLQGNHKTFLRKRLFRLLDSYLERPVIWMCGPPGSGKTTLVNTYIENRQLHCLWYSVDNADKNTNTFFKNLKSTLNKGSYDKRKPLPQQTTDLQSFSQRFFEALYHRLKTSTIVVFDDLQEALPAPAFQQAISNGLSVIPKGITIILISRRYPPPTSFNQLRLKTAFVCWNKLRLTITELKCVMQTLHDKKFPSETISQLYEKTEGWVIGLALLQENIVQKVQLSTSFTDSLPETIIDYFNAKVFHKIDNQTLDFLLKTAFFSRFNARMAERLSGCPQTKQILTVLHQNHFFIEKKLVCSEAFYRYQPLFHDFLLSQAMEMFQIAPFFQLLTSASKLMEEYDMKTEADELLFRALHWMGISHNSFSFTEGITGKHWPLKIYTLGKFELVRNGVPIRFSRKIPRKSLALLKALIAFGGKEVCESRVSDELWPEAEGDAAHNDFKTTLRRLRQLIGIQDVILFKEGKLTLNQTLSWLDSWEFENLLDEADDAARLGNRNKSIQLMKKAVCMYHGHFLDGDLTETYSISPHFRLKDKLLCCLWKLGGYHEDQNQFEEAIEYYNKGIEMHELAEEFYQKLVMCHNRLGHITEALEVSLHLKKVLSIATKKSPSLQAKF